MTISTDDRRKQYPGNGVATVFNGPRAFSASQVEVYLVEDATGTSTLQSSGAYTLTGVGRANTVVTMNVAPPTGFTLLILRTVPYDQSTDITNQGAFFPEIHENAFDFRVMQIQQLNDRQDRSPYLPDSAVLPTGFSGELPLPDPLAPLVWKADRTGLENGSTTLTGDMLLRPNLASDDPGDGAALVAFKQTGTGAVGRTVLEKLQERVSVFDFIPVAEHAAIKAYTTTYDATLDLQNAIDSLPGGGRLHFPDGLYRISSPLTVSAAGVTLEGDTPWKCALQQTDLGLGILTLESTANNTNVRNLRFSYVAGTPTGGFAIDSQGGYNCIDNIVISQCHGGVKLSVGAGQKLTNFDIFNYESIGVLCESINDILISDFVMNAGTIARGLLGGIRLNNKAEAIMVNRGDILLGKYSLTTDAALYSIGVRPAYCNFTDVFFDSSERGSVIDKMVESEFVGCWFSGGRTAPGYPGLTLNQSDSLKFTNTRFFNNGSHGLSVTSTAKRLVLVNCSANSNSVTVGPGISHGLFFGANVTDFSITGCTSTNGLYTGTQGYGLYLTAGCDNFAVRDNMLSGNATGAINDLASAAVQKYIAGNIGYRTHQNYTVTVAVGTSSTVVAHGFPFTPSASDFAMAPVGSPSASSISTYWISGLGATNFTVNTNANVAGSAFNIAVTVRSKGS